MAGRLCGSVAARVEKGIGRSCGSEAAVSAAVGWSAAMAGCILGVGGSSLDSSLSVWSLQSRHFLSVEVPVELGGGGVVEAVSGKAEAGGGRVGCVSSLFGSAVVWSGGTGVEEERQLTEMRGEMAEDSSWECSTAAGMSGRVASRVIGVGAVAEGRRAGL